MATETSVQIREHRVQLRDVDFGWSSLRVRMAVGGYEPIALCARRASDLRLAAAICCDRRGCQQPGLSLEGFVKAHSTLWYLTCPACGAVREIIWPNRAPEGAVVL